MSKNRAKDDQGDIQKRMKIFDDVVYKKVVYWLKRSSKST